MLLYVWQSVMCKYELVFTILINFKLRSKSMYMSFGGFLASFGYGRSLILFRGPENKLFFSFLPRNPFNIYLLAQI